MDKGKKKGTKRKSTTCTTVAVLGARRGRSSGTVQTHPSRTITKKELSLSWTYSYTGQTKSLFYSQVGIKAGGDNFIYAVSLKRSGDDKSAERPSKKARVWDGKNPLDINKSILDN